MENFPLRSWSSEWEIPHLFSHFIFPLRASFFPLMASFFPTSGTFFPTFAAFSQFYSFVFKAFLISDSQFCSFSPFGFQGGRAPGAGNERLALEWENKVGIFPLKWEKVSGSADRRSGKKVNRISHFSAEWGIFHCMISIPGVCFCTSGNRGFTMDVKLDRDSACPFYVGTPAVKLEGDSACLPWIGVPI